MLPLPILIFSVMLWIYFRGRVMSQKCQKLK